MVNYHKLAKERGLPHGYHWSQAAFVHDEYQCICHKQYASLLSDILVDGCAMIQSQFNTNIPIEADAVIGNNWAETH
jgi:DNA polymerase I-like protein with 3'-5' exonuclease and polymerase domains